MTIEELWASIDNKKYGDYAVGKLTRVLIKE